MLNSVTAHGVKWLRGPGIYAAQYRGFDISIRRISARSAVTGLPWRLRVSKDNGGSIAFGHQFWPTVDAARQEGLRLVDAHPAAEVKS